PLKTERGNRVFPVSDKAMSVLNCLQDELRRCHVTVRTGRVREILTENGQVCGVRADSGTYTASKVVLATGGVSYPTTGSTGDGYEMARALGHTIVPAEGSLVPLETGDSDCPDMQGLSLRNVAVKVVKREILHGCLLEVHRAGRRRNPRKETGWERVKKSINVYGKTPHCFRHTFATRAHRAGVDDKTLQTMGG
ncbi:MAG: NAD(P)/FAD-dependent oxidoreductase, partial [Clostridia bacterium]|nr:NAD(P)/FAD-dependent oxidoreductase [Clostridia bacterium]